MIVRPIALATACLFAFTASAFADSTVTVLHVNDNATAVALWDKIAADYSAAHKGVKVEFK